MLFWIALAVALVVAYLFVVTKKPKTLSLDGKRVIITGGSSGIGKAAAVLLARAGASVSIIAQNADKLKAAVVELKDVAKATGQVVHYESANVANAEDITRAVKTCEKVMGGVDILITSAGYSRPGRVEDVPIADWEGQMQVNYLGTVYSILAVLPTMKKQKFGRILMVSSLGGLSGITGLNSYCPTKFALRGLGEGLHMELSPFNIAVSVVNPPDVDTPLLQRENEFKPADCKEISAGSGLYTAEQVARDIVAGIVNWKFFINTGFDGNMAAIICSGTAPCASPLQAAIEGLTLGLLRIVGLGYTWRFYSIVDKHHKIRVKNGETI